MTAVRISERDDIAAVLRRTRTQRAYELGDLDDEEWPYTRWFGWRSGGELTQVVLLYTRPSVPVMLAIAADRPDEAMRLVVAIRDDLPSPLYTHASPPLLEALTERFAVEHSAPHLKLALTTPSRLTENALPVEVLAPAQLEEVLAFYADAYPGTWFEPRQLETGRYVGVRRNGRLACVAGVHVHSPTWGVAALGNVATLPSFRGEGLARGACAALCLLLLGDGIETIALNVRADNVPAIRAYERLGFEPVAEYVEASLVARTS